MTGGPDVPAAPPVPVPDVVTAPWWESLAKGIFAMARCQACGAWDHPPQERCRSCGGEIAFEPVSGRGRVFSYIVVRQQTVPGRPIPSVTAMVELDEQPGLRLAAVVDADPNEVDIGMRVVARIEPVGSSDFAAPVFALATNGGQKLVPPSMLISAPVR